MSLFGIHSKRTTCNPDCPGKRRYDKEKDITWRSWSPLSGLRKAIELDTNLLRFVYDTPPQAKQGTVFQMRDGIRDQACGLIQYSKNVTLEGVHLAFLGNFGIVGQITENITYRNLTFEPEAGSGRTCAGFADFVHRCQAAKVRSRSKTPVSSERTTIQSIYTEPTWLSPATRPPTRYQ